MQFTAFQRYSLEKANAMNYHATLFLDSNFFHTVEFLYNEEETKGFIRYI